MTQHLISGSYERFVFAHKIQHSPLGTDQAISLDKAFSFPAHKAAVKCVATSAPFIASGGADDTVHIYNAKASKDLGFLMNPGEGAVTAVTFYTPLDSSKGPSHLLSGSADGCIAVWAVESEWDCVKTLKGHKKEVTGLSVHPTGLLALSTARDDMLRMWNMAKGRSQYKTKIAPGTEAVSFGPDDALYALLSGSKAYVHDVAAEGASVAGVELQSRALSMAFISQQIIAIGCENGSLLLLDARSGAVEHTSERAHTSRIRGVAAVPAPHATEAASTYVGSASSDGAVKLWDLRLAGSSSLSAEPMCEAATSARLTCLAAIDLGSAPGGKGSKALAASGKPAGPLTPQRPSANGTEEAHSLKAQQSKPGSKRKLKADDEETGVRSASAPGRRKIQQTAGAAATQSQLDKQKHQSLPGKGMGKYKLDAEQEHAKQESLKQAKLKKLKREEKMAAAEAQKSGIVVQKEAEMVVEFPEVSRPPKAAKKVKRHKGK